MASVIDGGPSEKVGLQIGDKLLRINGEAATGDTINNNFVFKRLRGKKGTLVTLDVLRQGTVYTFEITRDKVPIYQDEWIRQGLVFHGTDDVIDAIEKEKLPKRLMMTTHPQRWTDQREEWLKEKAMQSTKNMVKGLMVWLN